MSEPIYKVVTRKLWAAAAAAGVFRGAPIDVADGFLHFSTSKQLAETVAKHFGGQQDLLLVAIDPGQLGDQLRWEPSRGGELFPHLYGELPLSAVLSVVELPSGENDPRVVPAEPDA